MPRRETMPDLEDEPTRVKAEKISQAKVKQENARKGKARAVPEEQDAHDQGADSGDVNDEQEEGSPRGHKRSRVNTDGDARAMDNDEREPPRERVKTLPRDTDGFIPGSITRIHLQNFVTYDEVEFRPGPYLNMIIGPNGTGKSSIACAICLGLNWPPSILGRANELSSFVKQDTEKGFIEIELKAPKGQKNLVIRRNLSATSKGSTFTLNGASATGREIAQKMIELNVQVGNLCSFLPQDKVSEFAAMSPQQLLRETQRAAGDPNLTSWHDTLISAGKEQRQTLEVIQSENDQLKQMRDRNDHIERDVQRFLERKAIEHTIELLTVLIPVQTYRELRVQYMELKTLQRKLHDKVKSLKEKNAPAHALLKKLELQYKDHDRIREKMKKATQNTFQKMSKKYLDSEKLETEAQELEERLENLKREERERASKIRRFEAEITKIEEELQKVVKLEKEDDLKDLWRQLTLERQDVISRKRELEEKMNVNIDSKARLNATEHGILQELMKLDNHQNQKLQALYRYDKDSHDVVLWLRQNRDKFRMPIIEPPMMCLTIPNKNFANAVEACFSAMQLRTFVAQCHEDYNTFNRLVQDGTALGRKVRLPAWFREQQANLMSPPPMTRDEMAALGFDGYALDYVECPQELHWFLQAELQMHRTAIALKPNAVDVNQAMQAVARPGPNGRGGGASFITGMLMHIVSRSSYGRRAVQNMTRDIRQARNLVAPTIDPEIKRNYETQLQTARQEMTMVDEEHETLKGELRSVEKEDSVFETRVDNLKARKKAISDETKRQATLKQKHQQRAATLEKLRNEPSADRARADIKKKLFNVARQRVVIVRDYAVLARSVITEQTETTRIGLEFLQIGANKAALQELCDRKDTKYENALREFNEVDATFQKVKKVSMEALKDSREVISQMRDELQAEYKEIEDLRLAYEKDVKEAEQAGRTPPSSEGVDLRTVDELEAELEAQKAQLDITLATNPGVVEQYEKRKRDIEVLEKTVEERQKRADRIGRDIKNARENWKPALETLVESIGTKFSAAFDRIGCAGEIRISENEDYEKWAIDILVKFRDDEKLQLLTGQRQSGGERSLTTILYLMSLTEEARAPFSLVDEINQGMDQRAERVVHNNMVEVTCKDDSAQYFLITPKLLTDLEYHKRMKVLCVNNGEWLPEERGLGNMMNMIEAFTNRRARSTAAT